MNKRSNGGVKNAYHVTRWYNCQCEVCGTDYQAKRYTSIYCSSACKQKAYRERRQQRKVANPRALHADDYNILKHCVDWHPDVASILESIRDQHGEQAMIDAAHLAGWMRGLGQYS